MAIKRPPASPTVLDAFTRADSTELGASWTALWSGQPGLKIVSNEVQANTTGIGAEYWTSAITSADQWVTAKMGTTSPGSSRMLMLRMSGVGTSSVSGYRLFLNWNESGEQVWFINKQTAGSSVWSNHATIASAYGRMPAASEMVGFSAEGTLLTGWIWTGSIWEPVVQVRDSSFTSGSTYAALACGYSSADAALDDFACGELSATDTSNYPFVCAVGGIAAGIGKGVAVTVQATVSGVASLVAALSGLVTARFDPPDPTLATMTTARVAGFDPPDPTLTTTTTPDVAGFDPPAPRLEV